MDIERIKEYWERAGQRVASSGCVTPTSRDPYLARLEKDNIISCLDKRFIACEIGCGDASHTVEYAKYVNRLTGIDVAESLVNCAHKKTSSVPVSNLDFVNSSVLDIEKVFGTGTLDCVISQRCLISLPTWNYQMEALTGIHSVLRKGGLLLLSEGFQERLDNLNVVRQKVGLNEIKVVSYNRNFVEKDFQAFISRYFHVVGIRDYGMYLFLSRVFHPLAVLPSEPKHNSKLNSAALDISRVAQDAALSQYSYNLFYVLKKK